MEMKNTVRKNISGVWVPAKYHITDYINHLDTVQLLIIVFH